MKRPAANSTPPQKAPLTLGPNVRPPGTATLPPRRSSCQLIGSSQRSFVFGPVGPLFGARSFSPQSPSYATQARLPSAGSGSVGTTTAASWIRCDGAVESSHPIPCSADRPSQSWSE